MFAFTCVAIAGGLWMVYLFGRLSGESSAIRMLADVAISDAMPTKWWREALVDARARKEKGDLV